MKKNDPITAKQIEDAIEKGFKENVLPLWKEWEKARLPYHRGTC